MPMAGSTTKGFLNGIRAFRKFLIKVRLVANFLWLWLGRLQGLLQKCRMNSTPGIAAIKRIPAIRAFA